MPLNTQKIYFPCDGETTRARARFHPSEKWKILIVNNMLIDFQLSNCNFFLLTNKTNRFIRRTVNKFVQSANDNSLAKYNQFKRYRF